MIQPLRAGDAAEIGGYRVFARLGAGGMGEVFLGRSASGRLVAIKVVRSELSEDPDFRIRFRREVDASRRVSAFHTAAVVAADADATPAWMVSEYIPGPSLEEAVRQHGPFPVQALRVLGAGLAEALEAIHASGLIHRDLKPSNILLAEDGPRVIDFGIVRALEGATVTQTGFMVGSVGFLSPEQLMADRITAAADVFALGAVLCAAAGLAPFGGGSAQAMLYRVVHTEPDLAGLPEQLREIVTACLAKDPAERPRPMDLVHMLTPGPTGDWLPPAVLGSIFERREHAQQIARLPGPGGLGGSAQSTESTESATPSWAAGVTGAGGASGVAGTTGVTPAAGVGTTGMTGVGPAAPAGGAGFGVPKPPGDAGTPPGGIGRSGVRGDDVPYVPSAPVPPPPSGSSVPPPPHGFAHGSGPGAPPATWPASYPPGPLHAPLPPHTPPRGTRLDRLPGGRRVWLTAIIATALIVLAGAGIATALLLGGDDGRRTTAGPTGSGTGAAPRKGGTLTVSINADSTSLDPFTTWYQAFGDGQRMAALYDPLVVFTQSSGKVEPHLAKSLAASPDGYTWTLELRPNVRFSDGTPLDAEAVKFNWQRHGEPAVKSAHANAVRGLSLVVVSPTRLDISLPAPDRTFDHLVADELAYIASPTALRANPEGFGKQPVGAGPFKLESWTPGDKQVFVRNPDYWQGPDKPLLDSLVFDVDTQKPVGPVIEGVADVNFQSATRDLQQARSAGLELVPTLNTGGVMLGFNAGRAPFDDRRARQAVAYALDGEALARDTGGTVTATRSVIPSTSPLRAQGLPGQPEPDKAKAQALFDELAREGKPVRFTVLAGQGEQRAMDAIKAQLAGFRNVTMDYRLADAAGFGDALTKRDFQGVWGYESGSDLDTWLFALTRSGYDANYLAYGNTAVDAAWDSVRAAATPQAKTAAYRTLLQALAADPPWWLYAEIAVFAVQRKGAVVGLDGAYADGILRWDRVGRG